MRSVPAYSTDSQIWPHRAAKIPGSGEDTAGMPGYFRAMARRMAIGRGMFAAAALARIHEIASVGDERRKQMANQWKCRGRAMSTRR